MDKLQPLLTHRFWIITALALILTLTGWMIGTGSLKEQYAAKASTLKEAFNLPDGSSTPNEKWIEAVDRVNKKEQATLVKESNNLWDQQLVRMYWPAKMQAKMKQYPYLSEEISLPQARRYRLEYYSELMRLWQSLDPYSHRTGKGRIDAPQSVIPYIPQAEWSQNPPTPIVMWHSMEDIWLLQALFDSINKVNSGARSIAEAPIRKELGVRTLPHRL